MADNASTGGQGQESGTQNGTQEQGQESGTGNGTGTQEGQGQQGNQQNQDQFDFATIQDPAMRAWAEKVDKDAKEAREQAARYRTERNAAQTKVDEFTRQNESDQQRQEREAQEAATRMETLEKENRQLRIGTALQAAATGAKAFNPALVASMLDSKVTLDDKGEPQNVQDLLKDLRESDPYLFKRADGNAGEGTGQEGQPTGSMNDLIRGQVAARRGRTTTS